MLVRAFVKTSDGQVSLLRYRRRAWGGFAHRSTAASFRPRLDIGTSGVSLFACTRGERILQAVVSTPTASTHEMQGGCINRKATNTSEHNTCGGLGQSGRHYAGGPLVRRAITLRVSLAIVAAEPPLEMDTMTSKQTAARLREQALHTQADKRWTNQPRGCSVSGPSQASAVC